MAKRRLSSKSPPGLWGVSSGGLVTLLKIIKWLSKWINASYAQTKDEPVREPGTEINQSWVQFFFSGLSPNFLKGQKNIKQFNY